MGNPGHRARMRGTMSSYHACAPPRYWLRGTSDRSPVSWPRMTTCVGGAVAHGASGYDGLRSRSHRSGEARPNRKLQNPRPYPFNPSHISPHHPSLRRYAISWSRWCFPALSTALMMCPSSLWYETVTLHSRRALASAPFLLSWCTRVVNPAASPPLTSARAISTLCAVVWSTHNCTSDRGTAARDLSHASSSSALNRRYRSQASS
mmetsp:Transcript_19489/g.63336  ORF Transcript_19489/g.63336 Transcript_19489/m.63336 type:complete len:206 (-) Transcript_19489:28-645(-)